MILQCMLSQERPSINDKTKEEEEEEKNTESRAIIIQISSTWLRNVISSLEQTQVSKKKIANGLNENEATRVAKSQ